MSGAAMTKIVLKTDAAALFELLKTPMGILLHPVVIAFQESERLVYVADRYATAIMSRLTEAAAPASLSVEPQDRRLTRSATYSRYRRAPFRDQKPSHESKARPL